MIGMPWTTRALSDLSFRHCVSTQFQNSWSIFFPWPGRDLVVTSVRDFKSRSSASASILLVRVYYCWLTDHEYVLKFEKSSFPWFVWRHSKIEWKNIRSNSSPPFPWVSHPFNQKCVYLSMFNHPWSNGFQKWAESVEWRPMKKFKKTSVQSY
jgi:hypothetical protein